MCIWFKEQKEEKKKTEWKEVDNDEGKIRMSYIAIHIAYCYSYAVCERIILYHEIHQTVKYLAFVIE